MTDYRIENGDGDEISSSVPSWDEAARVAQEHADRLGRSVYIWGPYADEGMEVGHLPAACCVDCGHPIEPGGPDDYDHRQSDRIRCCGRACVARGYAEHAGLGPGSEHLYRITDAGRAP